MRMKGVNVCPVHGTVIDMQEVLCSIWLPPVSGALHIPWDAYNNTTGEVIL